jgi:uncharacterized delta-60 repeat protein
MFKFPLLSAFTPAKIVPAAIILSLLTYTVAFAAGGDLDRTFSGDGKVITNSGGNFNDQVRALALQPNGKIVAVGDSHITFGDPGTTFFVARYNTNGSPDITFSGDGKVKTSFGNPSEALGVTIQSDGKIVVVGQTCTPNPGWICNLAVARYNANGSLDTTFSGDGKQIVDFGRADNGSYGGVVVLPNGKIVIAGRMFNGTNSDFALYRLHANGALDTTFSADGRVNTGFGAGTNEHTFGLAVQPDHKLIIGGQTCDASWANCDFALARYTANGVLDATFSGDGRQRTNFGANEYANAIKLQADGKIVLAGRREAANGCSFALARYNTNGVLDTTFSGDGRAATLLPSTSCGWWNFLGLGIQSTGKIVIGGNIGPDGAKDFMLARYTTAGALDTTFSGDGKVVTDFGGNDGADALAVQANDRIIAAGFTDVNAHGWDFALARYLP